MTGTAAACARRASHMSKSTQLSPVAAYDLMVLMAAILLVMITSDVRRLAVAPHSQDGQSVPHSAADAHMSRRTLTRFLAYVDQPEDAYYDLEKWKSHPDNQTRCPDLCAAVW